MPAWQACGVRTRDALPLQALADGRGLPDLPGAYDDLHEPPRLGHPGRYDFDLFPLKHARSFHLFSILNVFVQYTEQMENAQGTEGKR